MKTPPTKSSRRSLLKKSATTAFGFSVMPSYLALGKPDGEGNVPPSQRINLGSVGVGGRAASVIPGLCTNGFAQPVALCDVDLNARNIEKNLERYPGAKQFADFRIMLDKMGKDIDAVSVVTPDHTHYVAAIAAMQLGKHVYVEKPLTHTYREADLLMQAEKKYKVVTQMGNQGHTSSGSEQFKRLVNKGIIKDIVKIEAWKSGGLWFMDRNKRIDQYPTGEAKPATLNWDLWCGPKEMKPFSPKYHPFSWRGFHLYGAGMLGDWGAHIIDFAHDFLKLGLPTTIEAIEMADHNQIIFPLISKLAMRFPERGDGLPACEMIWEDSNEKCAPEVSRKFWDGEKSPDLRGAGTLLHRKDGAFVVQRGSHASVSRIYPRDEMMKYKDDLKVPGPQFNHQTSFIQACLGNGTTNSPFSVAAPLTKVLLLGVICQYLNESLEFDPETETFKGNAAANDLLAGPTPRSGWEGFYEAI